MIDPFALERMRRTAHVAWTVVRAAGMHGLAGLARGLAGSVVQIETTRYCNFRCSYCPTHSPNATATPNRGHMSVEMFTRILDAHPRARFAVLQGQGAAGFELPAYNPMRVDIADFADAKTSIASA